MANEPVANQEHVLASSQDSCQKLNLESPIEQALSDTLFVSFDSGYYIGMMSGTSLDGMDAVICQFDLPVEEEHPNTTKIIATHSKDFPDNLREVLLALCLPNVTTNLAYPASNIILEQQPQSELDWFGWASREYAEFASTVVNELLDKSGITPEAILAIGCHGQTVRHRPNLGFTLQLVDPNIIAERTGISVVTDFRRRDMAVGGQGAPLAPAFHLAQFGMADDTDNATAAALKHRIVVNLGGIANITVLPAYQTHSVTGYDTGPANILLDAWYQKHENTLNAPSDNAKSNAEPFESTVPLYDKNGQWAKSGQVNDDLLAQLLTHPYFAQPTPKSTGREDFHLNWLNEQIALVSETLIDVKTKVQINAQINGQINAHTDAQINAQTDTQTKTQSGTSMSPEDVQATLTAFTAQTLSDAIKAEALRLNMTEGEVIICGGGAYNAYLLEQIAERLPNWTVLTSEDFGIAPTWVEAIAFAWLARQTIMGETGNLPAVTGASKSVLLGQVCFA
ncbi:anhydro-N-acetylmuramic acid kinase [Psychrobacter sp.]|uniref:anhydro-N-acetylmuramic acid kinase n=1 Tax=Psychrobacter sp. TaxID=56811 RepID=UPI0025FC0CE1|nr:anhydro-N-acetylmuramic acid kinase [Psychrobacter sp.]